MEKRKAFADFDFTDFWDDCDDSWENYISADPTDFMIALVEKELGYKLPASYIELMEMHNGGLVKRRFSPTRTPPVDPYDYIDFNGIMGIGSEKSGSLLGMIGSFCVIERWNYPDIGIAICDTPSVGGDMIMLDYRRCGPKGEPEVVHVDKKMGYRITFLAKDFETFIKSLKYKEDFPPDREWERLKAAKERGAAGGGGDGTEKTLSSLLNEAPQPNKYR